MASQGQNWNRLDDKYPAELIAVLRGHFARGPFRITAHSLAIEANVVEAFATDLLSELVIAGTLKVKTKHICPCERMESLSAEQAAQEVCVLCERAFDVDVPGRPLDVTEFVREAPQTRDVRWMLALHGMNTQGAWQEMFNWLVSRSYGRSVPVAIYKYGVVRPGAVIKFRQRSLICGLNVRIRRLSGESEKNGFGGTPDVIAHSLGTWLLGHALVKDPTLRVGRVILTGCILRPDFDWASLLQRGQVQAVFCHVATKDFWSRITHYIIPDSGPSGRRGFNDRRTISHVVLDGGHHSDFFSETMMPTLFEQVWQPFLTEPAGQAAVTIGDLPTSMWKETWWPFRATFFRLLLLGLVGGFVLILLLALVFGAVDLGRLFGLVGGVRTYS